MGLGTLDLMLRSSQNNRLEIAGLYTHISVLSARLQQADCKSGRVKRGQSPPELEAQLQQSEQFSLLLHRPDFAHDFQVHVSSRSTQDSGEAAKGKEGVDGWESKLLPLLLHINGVFSF